MDTLIVDIVKGITQGEDLAQYEERIASLPESQRSLLSIQFNKMADDYSSMATIASKQGDIKTAKSLRRCFRNLIVLKGVATMSEGCRVVW